MSGFVLRRLLLFLPQLLAIAIVGFALLRLLPVDPVSRIVGSFGTDEARQSAKETIGLDRSFGEQLGSFLEGLLTLDFGESFVSGDSVRAELGDRIPVTLQLIGIGFVLALVIAIPLGRYIASKVGGRIEKVTTVYALFAGAQPDFWWGLIFLFVFFFKLGWFPAPLGQLDPTQIAPDGPTRFIFIDTLVHGQFDLFVSALKHYALPIITLTFVLTGPILKIMRQSALDVISSDYLLYAKASGFTPKRVRRMTARNSFAPVVTITGVLLVFALGGAVLIETVFALPGLGRYALSRTLDTDFPAIQGAIVFMAAFGLTVYLVMDILYALLDPRVRHSRD
ncbi:MAG: ABC transporter permease [Actinomycetia bacterium]|nr:ABC transporter permease [Actinomycetes bacterium]